MLVPGCPGVFEYWPLNQRSSICLVFAVLMMVSYAWWQIAVSDEQKSRNVTVVLYSGENEKSNVPVWHSHAE